jgi:Arc/MetJ-type ribon-helix-helix transcriptional regulator
VKRVKKETLVKKVLRDWLDRKAHKESKDLQEKQELKETKDLPESKDQKETSVNKEKLAQLVRKVYKGM